MNMSFTKAVCALILIVNVHHTESGKDNPRPVHRLGDGHGKPFGKGRPSKSVPVSSGQVFGREFFREHVKSQEPVLYKGMYAESTAVSLWSDEYFLNLKTIPEDDHIVVETTKKENRSEPSIYMAFQDFVKEYNTTNTCLVYVVPEYLMGDTQIPSALQCPHYVHSSATDTIIWYSSGGTKSVVHTEPAENLHCVVSGSEKFVFVHPIFKKLVPLDGESGSYSNVDVDAVDYDKYPGLSGVEFQHAELEAGDCVYIPLKRIHQVESFGRTIALNFYWDPSQNEQLEKDTCNTEFDPKLTLLQYTAHELEALQFSPIAIKADILEKAEAKQFNFDEFPEKLDLVFYYMEEGFKKSASYDLATEKLKAVFDTVDKDSDGFIEESDVLAMTPEDWEAVYMKFKELRVLATDYEKQKEDSRDEL